MLLLASKSPRRQELLTQIGIEYKVIQIDVDESQQLEESPHHYVERIVRSKSSAASALYTELQHPILTADTAVIKDHMILGKPKNYDDFVTMMHLLSGTTHTVLSAIALQTQHHIIVKTNESHVTFADIPASFIDFYWGTQEPCDKAGGYAVQGLMAQFIQKIEGSYSGIMGLPLFELTEALQEIEYNSGSLNWTH